MCTKLTQAELKNCKCKMAQFCKRRQQLESAETGVISLLTVSTQSARDSRANPVKNLKSE
jgi:hypothetical protein